MSKSKRYFIPLLILGILITQNVLMSNNSNDNFSNETIISQFEFTYIAPEAISPIDQSIDLDAVTIDGSIGAGEYDHEHVLDSSFTMYYSIVGSDIYIGMVAQQTGWLSVGFGPQGSTGTMLGFDYIIAYVDAPSTVSILDAYGSASNNIAADTSDDVGSASGTDDTSTTIVEFVRALDTGDTTHDYAITDGSELTLHWGYDRKDDFTSSHDARGTLPFTFTSEVSIPNLVLHDGSIGTNEYTHTLSLDASFTAYYSINSSGIFIGVSATAAGWVSLGWANAGGTMLGYDYIIGYYSSGTFYIQDSYGSASNDIAADTSSDITSYAGNEVGGQTIMEFSRPLNTGDSTHDVAILSGESQYIQWGYDTTTDDFVTRHDSRGEDTTIWHVTNFDGTITSGEYDNTQIFDTKFVMHYTLIGDSVYIAMDAEALGWVSVGWGTTTAAMLGFDYIIAYVSGGTAYLADTYGSASNDIAPDTISNVNAGDFGGAENSTHTLVEFTRLLDTGDTTHDVVIEDGVQTDFHWGYDTSADDFVTRHDARATTTFTFSATSTTSAPDAASDLAASPSSGQVDLSWTVPGDGGEAITGQTVYRSTTSGSGYSSLASVSASATSYSDTTVVAGTTYYYVVTATNSIGEGSNSNEVTGNTLTTVPTSLSATGGDNQVSLSWTAPTSTGGSAITGYKVYRATTSGGPWGSAIATPSGTSYTDATAINGQTYYYVVSAINGVGESAISSEASDLAATAPSVPLSPSAVKGDGSVDLSWSTPTSTGGTPITGYKVYRSTTSGSYGAALATLGVTTSYTDNTAVNGQIYYFVITAINVRGESSNSAEVNATPLGTPSAPQSASASKGDSTVSLSWVTPSSDGGTSITGYKIYRSETSSSYGSALVTLGVVTSYDDDSAVNGVTYFYVITAINAEGESAISTEVSATPATLASAPQNIGISHGDGEITVTWETPASDGGSTITNYKIYRSATSGSGYVLQDTVGVVTTWTQTGLTNGETWYYVVKAVNGEGDSVDSAEVSDAAASVPGAPTGVGISHGDGEITITWTAPASTGGSAITGYNVYRSTTSGSYGSALATGIAGTSYTDSTPNNGQLYYYIVTTVNAEGESSISSEVSDTAATIPGAPTSLTATKGDTQVSLSWTVPSSNGGSAITQYIVYVSTTSGSGYSQDGTTASTSYTVTGLTNGETYYFVVVASNAEGNSIYSNEDNATPASVATAPQSLGSSYSDSSVVLTWSTPASDGGSAITGYNVYRSETSGSYGSALATLGVVLTYDDNTVVNGVTYYYVVKAVSAEGESVASNEINVTPATVASAPQNVGISHADGEITVTWETPASNGGSTITGYKIYRSSTSGSGYVLQDTVGVVTTWTQSGLTNGETWYYVVKAVNGEGDSVDSAEVSDAAASVPGAPTSIGISHDDGEITITWTTPASTGGSAITGYNVYRSTTSGSYGSALATGVAGTSYTDSTANNGQLYYYIVTAVNAEGESSVSSEVSDTAATVPDAPTSLTATKGDTQVSLSWTAPSSNGGSVITGYKLYRSTTSGSGYALIASPSGTSYTDTGLTNGVTYYYVVLAVNSEGDSVYSTEASAKPAALPTIPQTVTATKGNGFVYLTWETPSSDGGNPITNYTVYRSTTSGSGYGLLTTLEVVLNYNDTSAVNGITYYYVITAITSEGASAYSSEVSATPATIASVPQNVGISHGDGEITVTWETPASNGGSAITNYKIYRSATSGSGYALQTTVALVTSWTQTDLTNGETWYYVVVAVNGEGDSAISSEVSDAAATTPTVPQSLGSSFSSGEVILTWSAPASIGGSVITAYKVYRSETSGSYGAALATLGVVFTYTDDTVSDGTTYYFVVTAVNGEGESAISNEISVKPGAVPSAPSSPSATKGNAQVSLSWSAPSSNGYTITGYKLYRSETSGSGYALIASPSGTSYTDTGLTNGDTYYYVITAVNALGESTLSSEVNATPATIPSAPQSPSATKGDGEVSLNWSAPASDGGSAITGYKVYRSTTSGSGYTLVVNQVGTSYTDTGRTNGVTYYYIFSAINAEGNTNSTEVSATPSTVPGTPTNLGSSASSGSVDLTWDAPSTGGAAITSYHIYRSTTSGSGYDEIGTSASTSYTDDTVSDGTIYYYIVTAENLNGEGSASSEQSASPVGVPTVPQSLGGTAGDNQVVLTWTAPSSNGGNAITAYTVYRSTTSGSGYSSIATLGVVFTYTDTTAVNGQTYYYVVTATNTNGESAYSAEALVTLAAVPTEPQTPGATHGNTQIVLTWTAPADDKGYAVSQFNIYRSTTSGSGYTNIGNTADGSTYTYTDTGLTNGVIYYYVITAANSEGEGAYSSEVSAIPATVPGVPTSVSATYGNAQVDLSWSVPTSDGGNSITNYTIYRSTSSGSYGSALVTGITGTSYTDSTAVNGQLYYYVITAVNDEGEGAISSEVSATPSTVADAPTGLSLTAAVGSIYSSWTAPSDDGGDSITSYKLYRSSTSGSGYSLVNTTISTSYNDTSVVNGQTYYYVVVAININGESAYSTEASETAGTAPTVPQNFTGIDGDASVSLSWGAPASTGGVSILEYRIYRSTTSGSGYSLIFSPASDATAYTDTSVTNGVIYYYVITAVNSIGDSVLSSEVTAAPGTVTSTPQSPAISSADTIVTISWSAPASVGGYAVTDYNIYRSTTSGSDFSSIGSVGNGTTTSYIDLTVSNGVTYYYYVTAVNAKGESASSTEVSTTPSTVPDAPTGLTSTDGDGSVSLSWTAPSSSGGASITLYHIYRSTTSGSGYSEVGTSVGTTYVDNTVTNGVTYYYVITAENVRGESVASSEDSALPGTVPSSPTGLAGSEGNSQVLLSWTTPTSSGGLSITGYYIYISITADSYGTANHTLGVVNSYTVTGLTNGVTYYFVVSAFNVKGESVVSNEISATPSNVPDAVDDLSATKGDISVDLSWSAPSDGGSVITGYVLYRSTTSGSDFSQIATPSGNTYTDSGLTKGTTYYYYVIAVNANGDSGDSNEASATPSTVPGIPTGLSGTTGLTQISLSWTAPTDNGGFTITSFTLYRSTTSGSGYAEIVTQAGTTYLDTGLTNGVTYYYVVIATSSIGDSTYSLEFSEIPGGVPSVPQSVSASEGNGVATITWSAPATDNGFTVIGYTIYRSTTSGSGFAEIGTTSGTTYLYADSGLTNGVEYFYIVIAVNSKGDSSSSTETSAIPATVPGAPTGINAVSGNTQISLSWTAPASDGGNAITGYRIFRSVTSGSGFTEITTTTGTSYVDTGLSNGIIYYYYIVAYNSYGDGGASAEDNAKPQTVPDAIDDLSATKGDTSIDLSWTVPSDGGSTITGYVLYRSTTSGSDFSQIATPSGNTYTDSGLTKGTTYYYYVIAVNANGNSADSNEASATPSTVPDAPSLTGNMGMNQISLSWTAAADNGGFTITSYTLYRSTTSGSGYVEVVTQAGTTYLDTGLTNGVDYYYVVIATNSIGDSVFSLEFTDSPGAVPDMVTNVVAIAGNGQVDLSWNAAEDNGFTILQYNVYRSTTSGSGFVLLASPAGTSYSDNSAVNGVTYYYIITAQNAIGSSIDSAEVSALPGTTPTSPVNFGVTEGYDFVYLTWEQPASDGGLTIDSYSIYRSTTSGSGFVLIGSTDQLLYNDTDILQGVTYYYQISANNIKGESTLTLELYGTPGGVAKAVDDIVITIGDTTVMLNWTAPADGGYLITGYEIWIVVDGIPELLTTTTDIYYLHTGLVNGQEYTYYIIVVNGYGDSIESAEISGVPVTLADPPQNMNVIHSDGSIFLEWTAPYDGGSEIISYKIYRSDLINGTFIEIAEVSGLNHTDLAINGVQYYYYVVAITSVGTGHQSEIIAGMAMTIPDVPIVGATIDGNRVTLAWDAPFNGGSDILVYDIYQSYDNITYTFVTNTSSLFFTIVISTATDYYFKVCSVNAEGESPLSLSLYAYATIEPSVPQNFVHDEGQSTTKSIYLMWDIPLSDGGEEVTHYTLYKSIAGMELLALANVTNLFYNDTDLEFGVVYQYQLSAWNIIGESAPSKDVFVPSPFEEDVTTTEDSTTEESTTEEPTSETNNTDTVGLDVPTWVFPTVISVGAAASISAIILRRRGT